MRIYSKTFLFPFIIVLTITQTVFSQCNEWQPITPGTSDINRATLSYAGLPGYMVIDNDGAPNVVSWTYEGWAVRKYTNGQWQDVNKETDFYTRPLDFGKSLDGSLYVLYYNYQTQYLYVKKLINNQWIMVGPENSQIKAFITDYSRPRLFLAPNGTPYIVYYPKDPAPTLLQTPPYNIMKFNGSDWEPLSITGLELSYLNKYRFITGSFSLAFDSLSTPHLAMSYTSQYTYLDGTREYVMKYTDNTWSAISNPLIFPKQIAGKPVLKFDSNGHLYLAQCMVFTNDNDSSSVEVYSLSGQSWQKLTSPFSSAESNYTMSLEIGESNSLYITQTVPWGNRAYVKKYQPSGQWTEIGIQPPTNNSTYPFLQFDKDFTPYLYSLEGNGNEPARSVVKVLKNNYWQGLEDQGIVKEIGINQLIMTNGPKNIYMLYSNGDADSTRLKVLKENDWIDAAPVIDKYVTSIALDSQEVPHITYVSRDSVFLKKLENNKWVDIDPFKKFIKNNTPLNTTLLFDPKGNLIAHNSFTGNINKYNPVNKTWIQYTLPFEYISSVAYSCQDTFQYSVGFKHTINAYEPELIISKYQNNIVTKIASKKIEFNYQSASAMSMVIDARGTIFVTYYDTEKEKPCVFKLKDNVIEDISPAAIPDMPQRSEGSFSKLTLSPAGEVYLIGGDPQRNRNITVRKWNIDKWEYVGSNLPVSTSWGNFPRCLAFTKEGMPVLAFKDYYLYTKKLTGLYISQASPIEKMCVEENQKPLLLKGTGTNISYQWQYNNSNSWVSIDDNDLSYTGSQTDSLSINVSSIYKPTLYRCSLTSACGNYLSESVGVSSINSAQWQYPNEKEICRNHPVINLSQPGFVGTFSGNGVTNDIFDPSACAPGWNKITYSIADDYKCKIKSIDSVNIRACDVTNINDETVNKDIITYPNPATDRITIRAEKSIITDIILSDLSGRQITKEKINSSDCILDLSQKSVGFYILEVFYEDKKIIKKIIKE